MTKLYIATDSNPVDMHTYELCSDLVDVVIDVSYIYGGTNTIDHSSQFHVSLEHMMQEVYDNNSASVIRLNNGSVLYLRAVSNYLALICVMREEYFTKRAILDYNIDCLQASLTKVLELSN